MVRRQVEHYLPELERRADRIGQFNEDWRRRPESNRRIAILQTAALTTWLRRLRNSGAEEGIRTLDLLLGKQMLYQLSYFRI